MEEKNEKMSIDTEELKNQTVETAKKLKETIKDTDIKEETKKTKGFLMEMFKNPLEKIKEVANDNTNAFLKTAIILIVIWTAVVLIDSTFISISSWEFSRVFKNILSVLKDILAPSIGILVYSAIVLILNKKNKKSLITAISTVTITKIPLIISELVSLLTIISSGVLAITVPFAKICSVVSIVLGYFGFKFLFEEEEDNTFIKKYVIIQIAYHVAYIVIRLFGIYI